MLLEPGSEASLGLSDVDLSTRAWYLVHDVRLLLDKERVFDLRLYLRAWLLINTSFHSPEDDQSIWLKTSEAKFPSS